MKAMKLQDDVASSPADKFRDHYKMVFHLTSIQGASKNCHYPELAAEPTRLELNITFPPEHVSELILIQ